MAKTSGLGVIATDGAPKAIGPYSQAITLESFVFTAGQVALDPKSGELVGRTTAEQTEQVFANLKAVLAAAGTGLGNVVKTTVYLADMADFAQMNEVYARHFGSHKPARSTVQAAGLPKAARVEIDVIAVRP
ncbi:MAG TPA: RidA family protein [Gemmatimonadales bacterium]|nr:RidA family protein [Gemmatimonadales bacterium]